MTITTGLWYRYGGVWTQMGPGKLYIMNIPPTGWAAIKKMWFATNYHVDPATLEYTNDWILIGNWTVPTGISVPGVAIAKRPATQITYGAQVSWTQITNPDDDRYDWNVVVFWHNITTGDSYITEQAQINSGLSQSPQWAFGDQVYADVFYSNSGVDGPATTTSTIILGP